MSAVVLAFRLPEAEPTAYQAAWLHLAKAMHRAEVARGVVEESCTFAEWLALYSPKVDAFCEALVAVTREEGPPQ